MIVAERTQQTDDNGDRTGIRCPSCGCRHCPVQHTSRATDCKTRRYRTCRYCGRRFSTVEKVTGAP